MMCSSLHPSLEYGRDFVPVLEQGGGKLIPEGNENQGMCIQLPMEPME